MGGQPCQVLKENMNTRHTEEKSPAMKLAIFLIYLFLATSLASSVLGIADKSIGVFLNKLNTYLLLLRPLMLVAAVFLIESKPGPKPPLWRRYVLLMLALGVFSGFWGVGVNKNSLRLVAFDLLNLTNLACFFVLARHDIIWRALSWPTLLVGLASLVVSLYYTDAEAFIRERSAIRSTGSYDAQDAFAAANLFVLTRGNPGALFAAATALFLTLQLALMLFFTKRAPSVRAILQMGATMILFLRRRPASSLLVGLMLLLASAVFLVVKPGVIDTLYERVSFAAEATIERMTGESRAADEMSLDDSNLRLYECIVLLDSLNPIEVLVGKGLGGHFRFSPLGTTPPDDDGVIRQRTLHIGFFKPVITFGFLGLIVYYFPIFYLMIKWHAAINSGSITQGCLIWAFIFMMFQFIEGGPYENTPQLAMAFAMVSGRAQMLGIRGG